MLNDNGVDLVLMDEVFERYRGQKGALPPSVHEFYDSSDDSSLSCPRSPGDDVNRIGQRADNGMSLFSIETEAQPILDPRQQRFSFNESLS